MRLVQPEAQRRMRRSRIVLLKSFPTPATDRSNTIMGMGLGSLGSKYPVLQLLLQQAWHEGSPSGVATAFQAACPGLTGAHKDSKATQAEDRCQGGIKRSGLGLGASLGSDV